MPHQTTPLAAAALLVLALGCRSGDAPGAPDSRSQGARAGDRYTVRGEIVRLPAPGAAPRELSIRHEAIPDFRDAKGAVVGMSPMVMPFAVPPSVPVEGLSAGDKIRFRFVMDWAGRVTEIESIEKLAPDTALDFGAR